MTAPVAACARLYVATSRGPWTVAQVLGFALVGGLWASMPGVPRPTSALASALLALSFGAGLAKRMGAEAKPPLPALPIRPMDRRVAASLVVAALHLGPLAALVLLWLGPRGVAGQAEALLIRGGVLLAALVAGALPWRSPAWRLPMRPLRASASAAGPLALPVLPPVAAAGALVARDRVANLARFAGVAVALYAGAAAAVGVVGDVWDGVVFANQLAAPSPVGWSLLGTLQIFAGLAVAAPGAAARSPALRRLPTTPRDLAVAVVREGVLRGGVLGAAGVAVFVPVVLAAGSVRRAEELVPSLVAALGYALLAGAAAGASLLPSRRDGLLRGAAAAPFFFGAWLQGSGPLLGVDLALLAGPGAAVVLLAGAVGLIAATKGGARSASWAVART